MVLQNAVLRCARQSNLGIMVSGAKLTQAKVCTSAPCCHPAAKLCPPRHQSLDVGLLSQQHQLI